MWICYSEDLLEGDNFSIETLRQTEGTIILHLNFAISMDQELGREFIKFLKVRKLQILLVLFVFTKLSKRWFLKKHVEKVVFNCSKKKYVHSPTLLN